MGIASHLLAIGAALLIAACGTERPNADAAASGPEASAEPAGATETATAECELPPELPDDTPLPPACTWVFEPRNVQDYYLIVGTRSSARQADVVAFFEEEMPALGWEINASDERDDGGRSLSMARGDERLILEIYPSREEGALSVQYVLT